MSRFSQVNKASLLFHIIATALFFLAFGLALTAAGLFVSANARANEHTEGSDNCYLFVKLKGSSASPSTCNYAIAGEVVTAFGLLVLILLSIVKMATCLIKLVFIM